MIRSNNMRDLEFQTETAAINPQMSPTTRDALLSILFRETDRAQRMKTPLCLILLGIDDVGHWNLQLGGSVCGDLLSEVARRASRILRSYDVLGRFANDEILVILPGCGTSDAMLLAERLSVDVFTEPFHVAGEVIRLSACFGIASSEGRSPIVVLREAEQALQNAKNAGPGSITCFGKGAPDQEPCSPSRLPDWKDESLGW